MSVDFAEWFESSARCAAHPHLEAERPCARCGGFCCDACLRGGFCEPCATVVLKDALPGAARSIAWKLLLGPIFLTVSAFAVLRRDGAVPTSWVLWLLPIVCTIVVLRRHSSRAAWAGALVSLALLGWQALSFWGAGSSWRLIDTGLLALAPLLALDGAVRLGRLTARVRLNELA